jgi:hypothetical protein
MSGLLTEGHAYSEVDHLASVTIIVSNIALPWLQQAGVHLGSILQYEGVQSATEAANAAKLTFRQVCATKYWRDLFSVPRERAEQRRYSSTHCSALERCELSTLPRGNSPWYLIRGPQEPVGKLWRQKISYPWRESNPSSLIVEHDDIQTIKAVFWDSTPCSLVNLYQSFIGTRCLFRVKCTNTFLL